MNPARKTRGSLRIPWPTVRPRLLIVAARFFILDPDLYGNVMVDDASRERRVCPGSCFVRRSRGYVSDKLTPPAYPQHIAGGQNQGDPWQTD
jgi:hypothetical protein